MAKVGKAESLERQNAVIALLLKGLSRKTIMQYGTEKWGVKDRQIDEYIAKANKYFATRASWKRPQEIGKAIERYNDLYSRCMTIQDYKTCLSAQKQLCELLGLEAPKQVEDVSKSRIVIHRGPLPETQEPNEPECV